MASAEQAKASAASGAEGASLWQWPASVARWLLGRGSLSARSRRPAVGVDRFRNICVSREAGAGGGTVARMVGTRLSWKVYDHELLEAIAHGMEIPTEQARIYDELPPSLMQDWILPLREEHYAPQEAYLDHLAKLVESIGKAGQSIIVGRGAAFLLPRSETLSVRLIAPFKARSQRLAERNGVSVRTARQLARDLDRRSEKFVRTLHRAEPTDPLNYDLVLDTDSLGLTIASELIVRAVEAGKAPVIKAVEDTLGASSVG